VSFGGQYHCRSTPKTARDYRTGRNLRDFGPFFVEKLVGVGCRLTEFDRVWAHSRGQPPDLNQSLLVPLVEGDSASTSCTIRPSGAVVPEVSAVGVIVDRSSGARS
jgi:hypothetical protein